MGNRLLAMVVLLVALGTAGATSCYIEPIPQRFSLAGEWDIQMWSPKELSLEMHLTEFNRTSGSADLRGEIQFAFGSYPFRKGSSWWELKDGRRCLSLFFNRMIETWIMTACTPSDYPAYIEGTLWKGPLGCEEDWECPEVGNWRAWRQ